MSDSNHPVRRRKLRTGYLLLSFLKFINQLADVMIYGFVGMMLVYGIYTVYDNSRIQAEADQKHYEAYQPTVKDTQSFETLKAINTEVQGWISLYGTGISHPFVQAENNTRYTNLAPDGSFSLSGSLFLDYRNACDFTDFNSFIYGHHMDQDEMFGVLDHYLEEDYFEAHRYGTLYFAGEEHGLEVFAVLHGDAYDRLLYAPVKQGDQSETYLHMLKERAVLQNEVNIARDDSIVLLSTCSDGMSNQRLLVAAVITDDIQDNPYLETRRSVKRLLKASQQDWTWLWVLAAVILAAAVFRAVKQRQHQT